MTGKIMDNWKQHKTLDKVEHEMLTNVLRQYGQRIEFDMDAPIVIAMPKHYEGVCEIEIKALWLENGYVRCKAEETEYGNEMDEDVVNDISHGFIGYLTEAVINAGKTEGMNLDPCRATDAELKSMDELSRETDNSVLSYLKRHDNDGNLTLHKDNLILYIGGMEFWVESLFVDRNCNPSAFGTSYEMEADIRINRLSTDNMEIIRNFCDNH